MSEKAKIVSGKGRQSSTGSTGSSQQDSSKNGKTAISTTTQANGGTRSSPPRVGGNGSGEAKDVKTRSAEKAKTAAGSVPEAKTAGASKAFKRG